MNGLFPDRYKSPSRYRLLNRLEDKFLSADHSWWTGRYPFQTRVVAEVPRALYLNYLVEKSYVAALAPVCSGHSISCARRIRFYSPSCSSPWNALDRYGHRECLVLDPLCNRIGDSMATLQSLGRNLGNRSCAFVQLRPPWY
jgi:hypothetical protein